MRCLGIPNTIHFQNVTLINDAKELWDKLKAKKVTEAFQAGEEEECVETLPITVGPITVCVSRPPSHFVCAQ
jgi:hypothetical protein